MNRFGFLLFLLVALGLASGTPAEGRRVARRARVDVGHPELEVELPGALIVPGAARCHLAVPVALPGSAPRLGPASAVHATLLPLSSCSPAERAPLVARSRAPPLPG
jgi:hypothetical protein